CAPVLGCRKEQAEPVQAKKLETPKVLFSHHFLGTKQLGQNTNADKLKRIWGLPETKNLREQVAQKLASAFPQVLNFSAIAANTNRVALLRPLLDDLILSESFCRAQGMPNQLPEWTLAINLDEARSQLWRTNLWQLVAASEARTPSEFKLAGASGWEVAKQQSPNLLRLAQA